MDRIWYDFVLEADSGYGRVSVECACHERGKHGGLYVDNKPICRADGLYRHLTGKWSWREKRALRRKLRDPELEWKLTTDGLVKSWKTTIDDDEVSVSDNGNVWVHGLLICQRQQRLYRDISAQITERDWELEMLGPTCPHDKTYK